MKGRPRLPIGTYGKITCKKVGKTWEARARFRAINGRLVRMKRSGPTKTAAENNLKQALREAADRVKSEGLSPATTINVLGAKWFEEFELAVKTGDRSPNSAKTYRGYLHNHVLPAMGELAAFELTVTYLNSVRNALIADDWKWDAIRGWQAVVSGICAYAVVHGAMEHNPVSGLRQLENRDPKQVRALSAAERADLFARLDADPVAVKHDIPDILRGLLSTGLRIGELLAGSGGDVERAGGVVLVRMDHRVIRVKGEGVQRRKRRTRSSKGAGQVLQVPPRSEPMWTRRKLAAGPDGPLFPSRTSGGWRDPSNVVPHIKSAMRRAGYEWVTSHVMRKTVASVLADAGLQTREVADQLGQATEAVTEKHYIEKRKSNAKQAAVLDGIAEIVAL